ncbi:MAG: DUF1501 domain-containing protein [Planctomycetota bacterium]
MTTLIRRREFLQSSAAAVALGGGFSPLLERTLAAQSIQGGTQNGKILVVITLAGGNDGLNTIVPFEDDLYYKARPTLAHAKKDVRKLTDAAALHPTLKKTEAAFKEGRFVAIQGVGYPSPNRSHFHSMDVWQTGDPELKYTRSGWLGRVIDISDRAKNNALFAFHLGDEAPRLLLAETQRATSFSSLQDYTINPDRLAQNDRPNIENAWRRMMENPAAQENTPLNSNIQLVRQTAAQALASAKELKDVVSKSANNAVYPSTGLSGQLKLTGQIIGAQLPVQIVSLTIGGFDTHSNQKNSHANLWLQIDDALAAFQEDLKQRGRADDVLVMIYSEFGRRVAENGSAGTDHGAAGPVFIYGNQLKGGVFGESPNLTKLDDGDVAFNIDYRRVYATILDRWLSVDSNVILGSAFEPLEFV